MPAALALLPENMRSVQARAMIVAICLQESELKERRQIGGPAHGYPQFEIAGARGVLKHPSSRLHVTKALYELDYRTSDPIACHDAIEHNDVLAIVFARLLLWTLPDKLPEQNQSELAWEQYLRAWRPGKPRKATWQGNFNLAWTLVTMEEL